MEQHHFTQSLLFFLPFSIETTSFQSYLCRESPIPKFTIPFLIPHPQRHNFPFHQNPHPCPLPVAIHQLRVLSLSCRFGPFCFVVKRMKTSKVICYLGLYVLFWFLKTSMAAQIYIGNENRSSQLKDRHWSRQTKVVLHASCPNLSSKTIFFLVTW